MGSIKKKLVIGSLLTILPLTFLVSCASVSNEKKEEPKIEAPIKEIDDDKKNVSIGKVNEFPSIVKKNVVKREVENEKDYKLTSIWLDEYLINSELIFEESLSQRAPAYRVVTSYDQLSSILTNGKEFYKQYSSRIYESKATMNTYQIDGVVNSIKSIYSKKGFDKNFLIISSFGNKYDSSKSNQDFRIFDNKIKSKIYDKINRLVVEVDNENFYKLANDNIHTAFFAVNKSDISFEVNPNSEVMIKKPDWIAYEIKKPEIYPSFVGSQNLMSRTPKTEGVADEESEAGIVLIDSQEKFQNLYDEFSINYREKYGFEPDANIKNELFKKYDQKFFETKSVLISAVSLAYPFIDQSLTDFDYYNFYEIKLNDDELTFNLFYKTAFGGHNNVYQSSSLEGFIIYDDNIQSNRSKSLLSSKGSYVYGYRTSVFFELDKEKIKHIKKLTFNNYKLYDILNLVEDGFIS